LGTGENGWRFSAPRFNRTVLDKFLRPVFRQRLYTSAKALQEAVDKWLKFYNHERPHQGYRNMGKRPIDTVQGSVRAVHACL